MDGLQLRYPLAMVRLVLTVSAFFPRVAAAGEDDSSHRLIWDYPRFRVSEYIGTGVLAATGLYVEYGWRSEPVGSWSNGILFDDAARDALRSRSRTTRDRAAGLSNLLLNPTLYFPVLDSLITPLVSDRGNTYVASQMFLVDWEAITVASLLTRVFERSVGRARPSLQECARDPGYDDDCLPQNAGPGHMSFFSGHTSMAFTGAALTCIHHQHLPLYGGNAADVITCAIMLGSATTIAGARLVADRHWASDVLSGAVLGLGSGYAVPHFLHYRINSKNGDAPPIQASILPFATPTGFGLALAGQM